MGITKMSVTANEELCKQPIEKRKYTMEFGNLLNLSNSEIISSIGSISSEIIDGSTTDLVVTDQSIIDGLGTDSKVSFWIEEGTDGNSYRIEVTVTTSDGAILQGDGILKVRDR